MAGDTFDAGTVYAEARLGRDEFQRDLQQLRRDMAAFERQQFRVRVGTDNADLDSGVSQATAKVRGLNKEKAAPEVGVRDQGFVRGMFSIRSTLKQVHDIVATPLILVDIVQSMARVAQLKYELRDLVKTHVIDLVILPQGFREVNKIADGLLSVKNIARSTLPLLIPLLGSVSAAGGAAAASITGAGAALGIWGMLAGKIIVDQLEKGEKLTELQAKIAKADTTKERAEALAEYNMLLAEMGPYAMEGMKAQSMLEDSWVKFNRQIEPGIWRTFMAAAAPAELLLQALVPLVNNVSDLMFRWLGGMERSLQGGALERFIQYVSTQGVTSLDTWGRALGNVGAALVNLLYAFLPLTVQFEDGFLGMTQRFLEWSQTIGTNQQFQELLRFTAATMPSILSILGQLLPILVDLHRIFAPMTEAVLGFVAGWMEAHPALTRFLVVGFVVSQFFIGLIALLAGVAIKIILVAAIFGRIGAVMAIGRTAGLLWGAAMSGQMALVLLHARTLFAQIMRLTVIGRIFTAIMHATRLWVAAQWLLNVAMAANPIGLVVIALAALAAGIYLAWTYSETFRNVVTRAWIEIQRVAIIAWEQYIRPAIEGIIAGWRMVQEGAAVAAAWIVSAWENTITFFRNLPGVIWGALVSLGAMIANGAYTAWNALLDAAQIAGNATVEFVQLLPGRIAYGLGYLAGFLVRSAIDGWNGFTSGIVTAWEATWTFIQSVPGRVANGLISLASWLSTTSSNAWAGFTSGLISAAVATWTWLQSVPGQVGGFLLGLGLGLYNTATNAWNSFTAGVVAAWVTTIAWLVGTPERVAEGVSGVGEKLGETASTGWAQFTAGLVSAAIGTWAWLTSVPGMIGSFFVGAWSWLWQAGADILNGLWEGLKSGWNSVWNFFAGLINSFIQGFKDAMGIASPSSVFAQFGIWILEGLLNGLVAFAGNILGYITGFGNLVVAGFQSFTGTISAAWNIMWSLIQTGTQVAINFVRDLVLAGLQFLTDTFGINTSMIQAIWTRFWDIVSVVAQAVFAAIRATIELVWSIIVAVFTGNTAMLQQAWDVWWNTMLAVGRTLFNAALAMIQLVWATIVAAFNGSINLIASVWSSFWNGLSNVATTVFGGVKTGIDRVIAGIVSAFQFVVAQVTSIWNGIRRALAAPVNFMINTVYNGGIVKAWNFVAGLIPGIKPIGTIGGIPEFAAGGPVKKDTILRAGEAGPEYILSAPAVRAMGGLGAVDELHRQVTGGNQKAQRFQTVRALNRGHMVEGADHDGGGYSTSGFGGVRPHVAQAGHYLKSRFGIGVVGGVGSRPNASDHPKGLALDFMTRGENGTALANHVIANKGHFGVTYAIWRQAMNNGSGWRPMENRGGDTANHMDHVHVSFGHMGGGGAETGDTGGLAAFFNPIPGMIRGFFESVTNPLVNAIPGGPPPFLDIPRNMARHARDSVLDFFLGKAGPETGTAPAAGAAGGSALEQVRSVANGFGWGAGAEWNALYALVNKESGWNPSAANPSSSARGLFQKMTSLHGPVEATAAGQAQWGLNYIKQRYGSPSRAWAHHLRNNSYDSGGIIPPGVSMVTNGTGQPELAGRLDQWRTLIDSSRMSVPGRDNQALDRASLDRLNGTMLEVKELLERRGAGATIHVDGSGNNSMEIARDTLLAARLS